MHAAEEDFSLIWRLGPRTEIRLTGSGETDARSPAVGGFQPAESIASWRRSLITGINLSRRTAPARQRPSSCSQPTSHDRRRPRIILTDPEDHQRSAESANSAGSLLSRLCCICQLLPGLLRPPHQCRRSITVRQGTTSMHLAGDGLRTQTQRELLSQNSGSRLVPVRSIWLTLQLRMSAADSAAPGDLCRGQVSPAVSSMTGLGQSPPTSPPNLAPACRPRRARSAHRRSSTGGATCGT